MTTTDMSKAFAEARARGEAANEIDALRAEVAGLRLMLREMGARPGSLLDHALRVQDECATLRTRAEQAEAERERVAFAALTSGADLLHIGALCGMTDDEYPLKAVERVVAEVARLRGELDGTRPKGWRDIVRNAALADVTRCITTLSVDVPADVAPIVQLVADQIVAAQRAGYEAALREAAGVARAHGGISASYAILAMLDAAPAAEGE